MEPAVDVVEAAAREEARPRLLLVGAVRGTLEDGRIGGQAFACRSLMQSRLGTTYQLETIDSSIASISVDRGWRRAPSAALRLARFTWQALVQRPAACIIFASHGLSFLEKGVMTIVGRMLGVRVLLMPRSGHLVAQVGRSKAFASFVRMVVRSSSLTICQSESWQQYFIELTDGQGRFRVVENWLPDTAFVSADAGASSSGGPYFTVGYFNRIEEAKGIFDFIDAVERASERVPALRAVIYGDGSCAEQVLARLHQPGLRGRIEFRGWLADADKMECLRKLDAYVFSSHVEGFPNSLLEVLALKVPVVSVRVGAVPDVIEDNVSGLLADVKDVAGIARAIEEMAQDPARRRGLAEAAYQRVRSRNTLEQAVGTIEDALA